MKIIRNSNVGDGWDVLVEEKDTHVLLHFSGAPTEIEVYETSTRYLELKTREIPFTDSTMMLGRAEDVLMEYATIWGSVGDKAREYFANRTPK